MERRIRVLGIAPYQGLKVLLEQVAAERTDIELTAVEGNLREGQEVARTMAAEYDVIMSRANTADLIGAVTHLPVIDIGISYFDVLRCIRQAKETQTPFAITGFHVLTTIARSLCDLMEYQIEIFTMDDTSDIVAILNDIKKKGYRTIVCDTVPYLDAKLMGLHPILLTTGMENIRKAFDQAVRQYQNQRLHLERITMLNRVISSGSHFTLVMDQDKKILFTANSIPESDLIANKIYLELKPEFPETAEFFVNIKNQMYSVRCDQFRDFQTPYYVCRVKHTSLPVTCTKNGIKLMDRAQAEESFHLSFYSMTEGSRRVQKKVARIKQLDDPVMICGERGTGKDKTACLIYTESRHCQKPLFVINCGLLSERNWKFLMTNYDSPFMGNDSTIYISNIDVLDQEKQRQLLSLMTDTNLHRRNRMIMSCSCMYQAEVPHIAMRFINMLHCFVVHLPPLREQTDSIRPAAVLYLDILNQQLGRQVTSLSPEALRQLETFDWPFNMTQFQRVLKEVVLRTSSHHIAADVVEQVLAKEDKFAVDIRPQHLQAAALTEAESGSRYEIDISRNLGDITKEVIRYVLQQHGGNQSAAAKQLGIGRTTMWRYLNDKN